MKHIWLGTPPAIAKYIFLLPNKPILPNNHTKDNLHYPDVALLVALNGNHWRKIFTIMAKLITPLDQHWRDYRDTALFTQTAMIFSVEQLKEEVRGTVFIVGNSFRDVLPIAGSSEIIGHKQLAYVSSGRVWCPYLDYRQFPNALIASLRERL